MANKLICEIGLPQSVANIFAARNILTAKDALSMPDTDLMILLDVGSGDVAAAVSRISEVACPPHQTALSLMEERVRSELYHGHLPTRLVGLDAALCGGIPFGAVTELVGPSGIGKTQISGARIKVSDRSDFIPGTSDRKVMITGRREAICVAEDMIMDIVESISQS